jgi:hypothetical protein
VGRPLQQEAGRKSGFFFWGEPVIHMKWELAEIVLPLDRSGAVSLKL